jgi:hypothetical protein
VQDEEGNGVLNTSMEVGANEASSSGSHEVQDQQASTS